MSAEKNKSLAVFMGYKTGEEIGKNRWKNHWFHPDGSNYEYLHFDDNWNLLMQVVIKIGTITGFTLVMEENTSYWVNSGEYLDGEPEFGGYNDISNIHEACVEIINWYNNQKKL
jgi:hypothetical protein